MKILCVADDLDSLVYSEHIKDHYGDVDVVISAGDLSLKYYGFIVSSLNKPMYYVFGNHNLQCYKHLYKNEHYGINEDVLVTSDTTDFCGAELVDGKIVRDKKTGLIIAGLGGSFRYNKGEHQFTDRQMMKKIYKMIPHLLYNKMRYGKYLDILLTHAPPLGIGDDVDKCHRGFSAFLTFMEWFEPKYLLHGHVHLTDSNAKRETTFHRTKVINVYKKFVIDDDTLGKKRGDK